MPMTVTVLRSWDMACSLSGCLWPAYRWLGREHGRTIPLPVIRNCSHRLVVPPPGRRRRDQSMVTFCITCGMPLQWEGHMAIHIRRRELLFALTGAAAWPLAARAQGDVPVVGYLSSFSPKTNRKFTEAFREGLNEAGFREGRNVNIEYRWAEEGRYETLPTMAVELVNRRVSVIFASPIPAALAAKAATVTIPIVFA